jgi:hypothetical protein
MEYPCPRVTFYYKYAKKARTKIKNISPECKHFLESYFTNSIITPEGRLFRMTRQNADYKWKCALKKAGLYKMDENTKRCTMTTHSLKRYFKTNFSKANFGNNEQWADYFSEHLSDLDRRYKDYDQAFIDQQYTKGVQYLLVYEKSTDTDQRIIEQQKEMIALKQELEKLKKIVAITEFLNNPNEETLERAQRFNNSQKK